VNRKLNYIDQIKRRVSEEMGPPMIRGGRRVALVYPSPYRVGMSSLGYQWILRRLRERGISAERCFLPDDPKAVRRRNQLPLTYETLSPLGQFPLIAVSLAYELELAGLLELLELAGIPVLRDERGPQDPIILLGGPLTMSNPLPAAPFVDAMLLGEADETAPDAASSFFDCYSRESWLDEIEKLAGAYIPERHGVALPPIAKASDTTLPARSLLITPNTELSNMFLIEGERGCHRQCSFCVMRRSTNGGMRLVQPEHLLSFIPKEAPKVGLVGAAISDHPKLVELLEALAGSGRGIGISSLRADRVARKPDIARLLRQSGARTLTVASDAASQRLRRVIAKGTVERHLVECAKLAKKHNFQVLKIYMMLGLPGETEEDLDELIRFTRELGSICRVALGIAAFVAKKNTPLDGLPFAGTKLVEHRIKRLQHELKGTAEIRPASVRWAWAEYQLAQGGPEAGLAVLRGLHAGGRFADYRAEFERLTPESYRPWLDNVAGNPMMSL
jgi:radical SAM superfamily enzyme YgiQ (UPF0313 family)